MLSLALLNVFLSGALASPDSPGSVRQQSLEKMQQMKFFSGAWNCTGTQIDLYSGEEQQIASSLKSDPTLDLTWNRITQQIDAVQSRRALAGGSGDVPAMPHEGESLEGYDLSSNTFVRLTTSNEGSYAKATSRGWQGDTLVWDGAVYNFHGVQKLASRKTIQRIGDDTFKVLFEVDRGNRVVTIYQGQCERRP